MLFRSVWLMTSFQYPLGGLMPAGADALDLHRRAMQSGNSLAPGPMFSASRQFGNFLRVNYGHAMTARVQTALKQVGRMAALK
jgi:DNA-binding transcriptional MocR family regulator